MDQHSTEEVQQKTRRIVARHALRKALSLVQEWQQEERENRILARRMLILLALLSGLAGAGFVVLYRLY